MSKFRTHSDIEADISRVIGKNTPFAVREAYRTLYTNIMYLPIESKCKKFVLTSAAPGEGKTSVSVNLAYTIAMSSPNSKILIVDADMRNPRLPKLIGISSRGTHGLSEFLAGIDDVPHICDTIHSNLSFLSSGAESSNTTALLSSSMMTKLMQYCDENYDYVIIDTPPLSIMTDAIFFSNYTDGYVVVTRSDYSDVNSVEETVRMLTNVNAKVIGLVLCSLDTKKNKRSSRYGRYGKYGKYGMSKYSK